MAYSKINGKLIHYQLLNEELFITQKPVCIFLHEGLGSIGQWKEFPTDICTKLELPGLLYERYGHGNSDELTEVRNPDYMFIEAQIYLSQLIDNLKITNKIILIGHSDGATISLLFASFFPEKVAGLILMAAHVFVEECTLVGIQQAIELYKEYDLKYLLERYHGSKTDSMFYGWADAWLGANFRSWNIEKNIQDVSCPTLIIQGDQDEYATLRQVESIARNISGESETFILQGCGHIPYIQKKDLTEKKIVEFILKNVFLP